MADEFHKVTRKKWITRMHYTKNVVQIRDEGTPVFMTETELDEYQKRLEKKCQDMIQSNYYKSAIENLKGCLKILEASNGGNAKIMRIICFGLGPYMNNLLAFHQLAFLISIQRYFEIVEAMYFDPVFREPEKKILKRMNCSVMENNCMGKYKADVLTLFYLPHCHTLLTNNLLWYNWQPDILPNVLLINNSFRFVNRNLQSKVRDSLFKCFTNVLPYVLERPLENNYDPNYVFNELSIHVFSNNNLPNAQDENFWAQLPEPHYEDDPEVISSPYKSS